jgi:hypothetical protein
MDSIVEVRKGIEDIIASNSVKLGKTNAVYYGGYKRKNFPLKWPQFFGTAESASIYVRNNNVERNAWDREYYYLHEYLPKKNIRLLNFTATMHNSERIQRLLDLIRVLIGLTNLPTMGEDMAMVELIALLSHLLFGLNLIYDDTMVDLIIDSPFAAKLAYPYKDLSHDHVRKLLSIIHTSDPQKRCRASRISFHDYDVTLMNALTFLFEKYQVPVEGICFFMPDGGYTAQDCCSAALEMDVKHENWLLCVPTEYIIFRPHLSVDYVNSHVV